MYLSQSSLVKELLKNVSIDLFPVILEINYSLSPIDCSTGPVSDLRDQRSETGFGLVHQMCIIGHAVLVPKEISEDVQFIHFN